MTAAEGLRVALFTDTYAPEMNGVARTIERLCDALIARGAEVRVFAPRPSQPSPREHVVHAPSVAFWAYPELRIASPVSLRIGRALRDWSPTLVHAATPFSMGLAGRTAARRLGLPFVTSYHTSLSEYAKFYNLGAVSAIGWRFLRWFHNSGTTTFVPTRAIAEDLATRGFTNLALWGRGVDPDRFHPRWRRSETRAAIGATDRDIVVAYVGRIAKEKGIDVALDGMRQVLATRRDVVFAIAGGGPYEIGARQRAPGGSVFVGRLTGLPLSEFYASADLFVFPSTTDTFGNVILEAMSSGLPVVGADVASTREVMGEGSGLTFSAGNAAAFARAVLTLVENADLRLAAREAALRRAASASWTRIFDRLVADYRAVERRGAASLETAPL
jgi:glycosyltransferase involved in cell wall biosynthesis